MAKRRNHHDENLPVPAEPMAMVAVAEPEERCCPCCGDHIHIPFKVDQEFKDDTGATYLVRVVQDGCLAPGAVPITLLLNLDQLPST